LMEQPQSPLLQINLPLSVHFCSISPENCKVTYLRTNIKTAVQGTKLPHCVGSKEASFKNKHNGAEILCGYLRMQRKNYILIVIQQWCSCS
jgi:hypothetical protein